MSNLQDYDLVALTETISATHKKNHQSIILQPGQVGTVMMTFEEQAYLIDFADNAGQTYAMETVTRDKLLRLIHEPVLTYA